MTPLHLFSAAMVLWHIVDWFSLVNKGVGKVSGLLNHLSMRWTHVVSRFLFDLRICLVRLQFLIPENELYEWLHNTMQRPHRSHRHTMYAGYVWSRLISVAIH